MQLHCRVSSLFLSGRADRTHRCPAAATSATLYDTRASRKPCPACFPLPLVCRYEHHIAAAYGCQVENAVSRLLFGLVKRYGPCHQFYPVSEGPGGLSLAVRNTGCTCALFRRTQNSPSLSLPNPAVFGRARITALNTQRQVPHLPIRRSPIYNAGGNTTYCVRVAQATYHYRPFD